MSDQLKTTEIDESTIDPAIKTYFENKMKGLSDKNAELLGKHGSLKGEIEALGGIDTVKALKAAADKAAADAETARLEALRKDGDKSQLEEHYTKLLGEKDSRFQKLQQSLVSKEVEAALTAAIAEEEGSALLLMPHLRGRIEATIDDEGKISMVVKGKAGETVGEDGKPLTLKSLVTEAKRDPQFGAAFKAHQASGGSNRPSGKAATSDNPFSKAKPNYTKQSELIRDNPGLAKTLATEAGVPVDW